jgi:hypothetical protein
MLLPAEANDRNNLDDEIISGTTKSEIKDIAVYKPKLSPDSSISEIAIKSKRRRKQSNQSEHSIKLFKNIRRESYDVIKAQNMCIPHSEINKPINIECELEFPNEKRLSLPENGLNTDIRTYEIDDEVLGKITIKTRVIESTEKLQTERLKTKSAEDLQTFLWDNFEAYYKKEERKAIKAATQPKVKYK